MTHVPVIFALISGLAVITPAVCAPQDAPSAGQVAVFLQFDHPIHEAALEHMKAEVGTILRPAGYEFVWILQTPDTELREYSDLVVVHFTGDCEGTPELRPVLNGEALAKTAISDGQVLPFTEVRCGEVRRFISQALNAQRQQEQSALLGRALGRVLSHEMFHMFAATREHGHAGVARPAHSVRELASPKEFRFDPEEIRVLLESKRRPAAVVEEPATDLRE